MPGKRHTPETVARIRQLADQGLTRKQIADHLRMTYCAVQGICDRRGIESKYRDHNTKAGQYIDEIRDRLARGDRTADIARDIGVTRHYLANLCKSRRVSKDGAQYRQNPTKAKAINLAKAGFSGPAVALILGKPYVTVRVWLRGIDRSGPQITLPKMRRDPGGYARRGMRPVWAALG